MFFAVTGDKVSVKCKNYATAAIILEKIFGNGVSSLIFDCWNSEACKALHSIADISIWQKYLDKYICEKKLNKGIIDRLAASKGLRFLTYGTFNKCVMADINKNEDKSLDIVLQNSGAKTQLSFAKARISDQSVEFVKSKLESRPFIDSHEAYYLGEFFLFKINYVVAQNVVRELSLRFSAHDVSIKNTFF
ncbi:MAG: hypothetical protein ACOYEC_05075 [Christensenellales bacterium]|jgi:hypothetical protein|nr:hypothetical protein [Clostridiales bacterium]